MEKQSMKIFLINILLAFIAGGLLVINLIVFLGINGVDILNGRFATGILLLFDIIILTLCIYTYIYMLNNNYIKLNKIKKTLKELDNLTQMYTFDYLISETNDIGLPFSLIIMDIDDFKEINDIYGLVIGDLVLKVVAKAIKENVRDGDIVARYQGDAFVIVIPNCSEKNTLEIMNRIRQVIIDNKNLLDKNIIISTSVGIYYVTEFEPRERVFRNAVEALKIAKGNDFEHKVVILKNVIENE